MQYAIKERAEGTTVAGAPFLRLTLANKQGELKAVFWDCPSGIMAVAQTGAVIEPQGEVTQYKGEDQLKLIGLSVVPADQIRYEDLLPTSPHDAGRQADRLRYYYYAIQNAGLKRFFGAVLGDPDFYGRYCAWPAALGVHHAWVGGLLDHSLEVACTAMTIADQWPEVDRDMLLLGALLHDVGKLDEIRMGATFAMTDQGKLLGHVALGMEWLHAISHQHELPPAALVHLQHLIASHHGQLEWGALQVPRTATAVALHLADLTSARMTIAAQALQKPGADGWTEKVWAAGTAYYAFPGGEGSAS